MVQHVFFIFCFVWGLYKSTKLCSKICCNLIILWIGFPGRGMIFIFSKMPKLAVGLKVWGVLCLKGKVTWAWFAHLHTSNAQVNEWSYPYSTPTYLHGILDSINDKTGNACMLLQPLLLWKTSYWVCVCTLSYLACKAHVPYCHPLPIHLYNIFPHYLINGMIFKKYRVFQKEWPNFK